MEALSLIGYNREEAKVAYKTFEDIENNIYFTENLKEILSIYKSEDNKLKNLIKNFFANTTMKLMEENIDSFYTYVLNELAIFKSVKNIFDTEEIFVVYHDIVSLTNLNTIQETFNHNINYLCVKIKDKKEFINYFVDDVDNIFILNKNFRYKYISKGMANRLGISENEAIDKTFFEIFGSENQEIRNNDKKVIFEGLTIETEECISIDNNIKYFKVVKKPLFSKNNEIIGLRGSSMDITEIKEAQIKAEKDKEEELLFRENYLHELNNVEHKKEQIKIMLREFELDEEQKQTMVEILKFEEEKTSCLIKNFALHNSISEGKGIEIFKKSTNIINLINREIEYYNLYYKYLNINKIIIFENDFNNLELLIDEIKISQVIHNLVKNADKHSNAEEIRITLSVLNDKVLILIKDNGVGINKEIDKKTLFIHDKNKKITKSGNGLGLPICKSIIERHDGDIYFKDIEVGTAIKFFLPFKLI